MTYQEFVSTQFIPRVTTALQTLRSNLVSAGVAAGNVTVEEVNPEGDLRWRITAQRGNRTVICYIELTAAAVIDNQMALQLTLWCEGNGSQITTSYAVGPPRRYDDPAAIDALVAKLAEIEGTCTGELLTAARAFLRV